MIVRIEDGSVEVSKGGHIFTLKVTVPKPKSLNDSPEKPQDAHKVPLTKNNQDGTITVIASRSLLADSKQKKTTDKPAPAKVEPGKAGPPKPFPQTGSVGGRGKLREPPHVRTRGSSQYRRPPRGIQPQRDQGPGSKEINSN